MPMPIQKQHIRLNPWKDEINPMGYEELPPEFKIGCTFLIMDRLAEEDIAEMRANRMGRTIQADHTNFGITGAQGFNNALANDRADTGYKNVEAQLGTSPQQDDQTALQHAPLNLALHGWESP